MGEYFKNQYHTGTKRLQDWDYSVSAFYYVTICTKDRICCFGKIKDDQVELSQKGKIVLEELLKVQKLRPYILVDDYIIMPNHLHAIFVIKEKNDFGQSRDTVNRVSTVAKFGKLQPKSLSAIVNTFKGAVTRQCNRENLKFQWQSNYYEHIIRNEKDLARIKKYIANNPINWSTDRNNHINL